MTGIVIACAIGLAWAVIGGIAEGNPYDHGPNSRGGQP